MNKTTGLSNENQTFIRKCAIMSICSKYFRGVYAHILMKPLLFTKQQTYISQEEDDFHKVQIISENVKGQVSNERSSNFTFHRGIHEFSKSLFF